MKPQPVTWPLTGGLAGKTSPLSVQPGSHLALTDVKQERIDEWRARQGFDAVAISPGPTSVIGPQAGGAAYMADADSDVMRFYVPGAAVSSYGTSLRDRQQDWVRIALDSMDGTNSASGVCGDVAMTSTTALVVSGIFPWSLVFVDKTTKTQIRGKITIGGAHTMRVASLGSTFIVVTDNAGNVVARTYDSTGAALRTDTVFASAHLTSPWLDVLYYSGSTVTIVVRTSGNQIRYIEYDPSTGSTATANLTIAVNADNCISLLGDPDASGVRYVAVSNAAPSTRVLRVNSAGTVLFNEQAEAIASTQIAGAAYTGGTEWQIVYQTSGGVKACKKVASIGAAAFVGNVARTDTILASSAWREISTDAIRFLVSTSVTASGEEQATYLEMTLPFGVTNVISTADEPQAVLLPLDGCLGGSSLNASLTHVCRDSAWSYWTALSRATGFTETGSTASRNYSVDLWHATYAASSAGTVGALTTGRPTECAGSLWFPSGALFAAQSGACFIHGLPFFPRAPSGLIQSTGAGALTVTSTYNYLIVVDVFDFTGAVWRSPTSLPVAIALTGTNNTVAGSFDPRTMPGVASGIQPGRFAIARLMRTAANGSVYQLVASQYIGNGAVWNWTDLMADLTMAGGDFLYTTSELETSITPRPAHVCPWGDRLWLVNADFRTELWFSKHIRPSHQPEFVGEFTIDLDDEFGDITGLAQLDDKLVVFKKNAIYLVAGDGPEDNGSGTIHATARIAADVGCLPGVPPVSTGEEIFFVSERGIKTVDRAGRVNGDAGDGVDDFFMQPTIRTPITVTDAVFVRAKNEVRFLYSGGMLVYDRTHKVWYRWAGGLTGYTLSAVVAGKQMLFNSTTARLENDTATTDAGTTYQGIIRSAWIRANESLMRLYRALVTGTRTPGGSMATPTLTVYQDNSDVAVQSFTPPSPIAGTTTPVQAEARPQNQNCASFSLQIALPPGDGTFRLERWGADVGVRGQAQKRPDGERWT